MGHMVHIKEDYLTNNTAALDDDEGYAVIALFYQGDDKKKKSRTLKKITWNNYFHYMGGFTTPNCYEVANWIIMREPLKVSESFLDMFRTLVDEGGDYLVDNFRPTQPLNGRTVYLNEKA